MRRLSRGEGKLGCIMYSLVFFAVIMVAYNFIPMKIATMQLEDHMKELAMHEPRKDEKFFRKSILERADELRLPVEKKHIKVKKSTKRVVMDVNFPIVIDLMVTDYRWDVKLHLDREIFLM